MRGKWYRNALMEAVGAPVLLTSSSSPSNSVPAAGKELPMYRLGYRPGCWPLRLRLTPPVYLLARFEFLFEDAIGVSEYAAPWLAVGVMRVLPLCVARFRRRCVGTALARVQGARPTRKINRLPCACACAGGAPRAARS